MDACRYFVAVAALDAVQAAAAGSYAEINRGKAGPLERMRIGDALLFYSPRACEGGKPLQAFTALARIRGDGLYLADAATDAARPFRRAAEYLDVQPAPIRPMIDTLAFIANKSHWGVALRFGFLRISAPDFAQIAQAMGCVAGADFARPPGGSRGDADARAASA